MCIRDRASPCPAQRASRPPSAPRGRRTRALSIRRTQRRGTHLRHRLEYGRRCPTNLLRTRPRLPLPLEPLERKKAPANGPAGLAQVFLTTGPAVRRLDRPVGSCAPPRDDNLGQFQVYVKRPTLNTRDRCLDGFIGDRIVNAALLQVRLGKNGSRRPTLSSYMVALRAGCTFKTFSTGASAFLFLRWAGSYASRLCARQPHSPSYHPSLPPLNSPSCSPSPR